MVKFLNCLALIVIYVSAVHCEGIEINNDPYMIRERTLQNINEYARFCTQQTGARVEIYELVVNPPTNTAPAKKCYLGCMLRRMDLINGNSQLNVEGLKRSARELTLGNAKLLNLVHEIGQACSTITDENDCELAYKIHRCILREVRARRMIFG